MLEASTTGHAQLRNKTINAEVNLLNEWQRKRDLLSEQITRLAIAFGLVSLLSFGSAPFLIRTFVTANSKLKLAQSQLEQDSVLLTKREEKKKTETPKIDQGAMHDTVVREAKQFLGHTFTVMNAAQAGMAFETVKTDVIGGTMTVTCKADAENNTVVETFLREAGKGKNVISTLLRTTQKDPKLSIDGVNFECVKQIGVTP